MTKKDQPDFVERNRAKVDVIVQRFIETIIPAIVGKMTGQIILEANLSQGGVGQSSLMFKRPLDLKKQIKK